MRLFFLLAWFIFAGETRAQHAKPLVLTHVSVVDVSTGITQPDRTVVIEGNRITQVDRTASVKIPGGAQVLAAKGKFLIPGLWDMHAHLSWTRVSSLAVLVANGVTGVRDMGGDLRELDDWGTKISAGLLVGPRILRGGPQLNGQKFNAYQLVTGGPEKLAAQSGP